MVEVSIKHLACFQSSFVRDFIGVINLISKKVISATT